MTQTHVTGRAKDTSPSSMASYNTVRRDPPRKLSGAFRLQITLYFGMVAILTALVMTCVLAFVWEQQFRGYTRENMQRLAQSTADKLSAQYQEEGDWTEEALDYARTASSASADVGVQVVDEEGRILYDDTWASSRRVRTPTYTSGNGVAPQMVTAIPSDSDSIVTANIVDAQGRTVGVVRLWAFGTSALLTKSDAAFRRASYMAIATSAGVALVFAFVLATQVARSLARPIRTITSTAAQIRGGDLTARTGLTGDDEVGQLGETFDSMAATLEHDIKFEHRLTSDVAHELRTPLMAMLVTVEAMQDGVLPADTEHLETVASETRRLSRLVDAMLHLSRIENGKRQVKLEQNDVVHVVRSLVTAQHQLFHEQGLHLRFDDRTPDHKLYAAIDADLIVEAVTNLMSNSMRYTSPGGWVVVSVEGNREIASIAVRDTGIGIAEEDIPKVFSRFWRSDASRERVSGGLGVGLALTKEIIDQHNGTIEVESELGKGTTFTLRIPIAKKEFRESA